MAGLRTYDEVPTEEIVSEWRVYKKRWLVMGLFFFCVATGGMQWTEFSSVAPTLMGYYGVSHEAIEWTSLVFMFCYLGLFVPVLYYIRKMDTRTSVVTAILIITLGSIVKVFSVHPDKFCILMVGQTIVATGQVFIYQLMGRVGSVWFGSKEISIGSTAGLVGDQAGSAVCFFISSAFVGNYTNYGADFENSLFRFNILIAGLASTAFTLTLFFFENNPPVPPSYSKGVQYGMKREKFWTSLKGIFTKSFMFSAIPFCFTCTCGGAVTVMLGSLIIKRIQGSTEEVVGVLGFICMAMGIVGSLTGSYVLDKTRQFKNLAIFVSGCAFVNHIFFSYFLNNAILIGTYITTALHGLIVIGHYGYGMQLVVEVTYPMHEETSCGFVFCFFQLLAILITKMYSWSVYYFNDYRSEVLLAVIYLLSFIMNIFNPGIMKRQQLENFATKLHQVSFRQ